MKAQPKQDGDRDPLFVASVSKSIKILESFNEGYDKISLSEMTKKTGLNKSAVQRFLYTWEQLGYLYRQPGSKRYQLTPKSLSLSFNFLRSHPLVEVATAILVDKRNRTKHTFNLSILDGIEIVYIVRVPNQKQALAATLLGRRLPAFCTSGGRAMMSLLPEDKMNAILNNSILKPKTPYTITDREKIIDEIRLAHTQGYAITVQESLIGEIVVASPVTDSQGQPIGAVHIPNNIAEWPLEKVRDELAPLAMEAARAISSQ